MVESIGRHALASGRASRLARRLGLFALLVAFASAPVAASAADPTPATITISATGAVTVRPDVAVVTVGVVSEARTSAEALAAADRAAGALLTEAAAAGVPKEDVATAEFSLAPQWAKKRRDGRDVDEIAGFAVSNRFTVRVRKLAAVGPLLERMIGRGSNSVSGLSFEVSDVEARREEARVAAVKAAVRRAETLTEAAGQRIVRVLTISEGGQEPPRPAFARATMAAAPAVPVEAGTETISAEVTMTFEIAPRSDR